MSRIQHRFITTSTLSLLLLAALSAPAVAREDPGPPIGPAADCSSRALSRVGTQLVRCDDLTGNGVNAPLWIPQR